MESFVRTFALATLGLFVLLQVSLVKSDIQYQCNGHEVNLPDEKLQKLKKCGETVGVKSMEEMTPEKIPCFAKCIMETTGLVDAQGKPHLENIYNGIDSSIKDAVKEEYKKAIEKCVTDHGHNISPKDETCLSYGPLAMCATKAFKAICHG